ncbi:polysaccharide deacetylase family protein [Bradyrhizobium sp. Tv2a-2]|uniref:polysaccharide deacetylase family protein n=1 Tax=Bradyrhizobium sp. Tv2a-2 TaxID=113395 RepID=UPI0004203E5A|nr:polysaccharide deacetylase family protein [Bradyrhizobium sp. Tv2a-2]
MRSALALMLGVVVMAGAIAAGWYLVGALRGDGAVPQFAAAHQAPPSANPPAKLAAKEGAKDDVEVTGAIGPKPAAPAPVPAPAPVVEKACANPDALGVSRVVEIDTTGGPGFGFQHFKQFDFLTDKEVVLTFDDGPWPGSTPAVLKALDDQCTKGLFFSIGKHATYHPEILKQVLAAGHTVGAHTWSHVNLNGKKMTEQMDTDEIEKGFSAVKWALGTEPAPFFRFPELQHNPAMVTYLGTRNVAMFSCDIDSHDYKHDSTPEKVVSTVMTELAKQGKGIILMHDFQKRTAEALPTLLKQLKAGGYKVVQIKAKSTFQTLPDYDEAFAKEMKLPTASSRPISSVVQTVMSK